MRISVISCFIFLMGSLSHADDCHLRVGWMDSHPYLYQEDQRFRGSDYIVMADIAAKVGCTLEMLEVPWARAIKMLERNELDMLRAASYTEEWDAFASFSVPYRYETMMLVAHLPHHFGTGNISLNDWISDQAAGTSHTVIGVLNDSFYGSAIDTILNQHKHDSVLTELNTYDQMLKMLLSNRIDGFIIEQGIAKFHKNAYPDSIGIRYISEQKPDPMHFMFSKSINPEIIQRFNESIQERLHPKEN